MMKKINRNRGFTLIEFILYIGLVGIILTVTGAIGLNVLSGKAKLGTIEEVSQNARFTMERMSEIIRNAETINSPATSTSASTLSLKMASPALDPTVFDLSSGALRIKEGSGSATSITSSEVNVSNLNFSNISYSDTPGTVRIEMTINLVNPDDMPEYNFEQTFYTTANIRKK